MKIRILLSCIFLITTFSFAQSKKGNIVQYFGKEKVEDINEGSILHLFNDGLLLKGKRFDKTHNTIETDAVFAQILSGDAPAIKEGTAMLDAKWEAIEAGEKNEFKNDNLRSGHLYLEYTSETEQIVLFEASGHTSVLINGLPHEGDHYDFGWSLIPIKLKKGKNEFILSGGRFNNMRARLLKPDQAVQFTKRDLTLPDLLVDDAKPVYGAIRIMNTKESWFKGGKIEVKIGDATYTSAVPDISPLLVRKVPFTITPPSTLKANEEAKAELTLLSKSGKVLAKDTLTFGTKSKYKHHKKTFISKVDGSVQYFSVAPSLTKDKDNQALFLSVHGASVEAVNQANAYKQKDWGHLVAPTNRRPYGFAWEDWGRLDALEVLEEAERIYKTDSSHTYLTGHSMGGHGSWYLGATYPDRFAAIAPCAGYPDLLRYRNFRVEQMAKLPEEDFKDLGITKDEFIAQTTASFNAEIDKELDAIIMRAGNPSRTLKLLRNYLHYGVFVLHGEIDNVVPTAIARDMRERLGTYHNDFSYYEYPNGKHWYGDESVDDPLLFNYFKAHSIKPTEAIEEIEFYTASPGVSSGSHYVDILQQNKPFEISSFNLEKNEGNLIITTENAAVLQIDLAKAGTINDTLTLDGQKLIPASKDLVYYKNEQGTWKAVEAPSEMNKSPLRNGGFKDAFRNNVVFVYASKGSKEENTWWYNKAKFDAEKFWYRANGAVEVVKDTQFKPENYPDQNIVLYGNKSNNAAWNKLLKDAPILVTNNSLKLGNKTLKGDQWGGLFIYPRSGSASASVGIVTATGTKGMKGAYANDYLVNATTYPDVLIFDNTAMQEGVEGVECSGFFGNDWSVEQGDFVWRN